MLTEQQIQERRNYLGASDIPILLGISPWQTPYDLYRFKAYGERSQEVTDAMQIGNFLEQGLVAFYSHKHDVVVETGMDTIFHPTKKYLACNLDGRIDKDTILEVKTGSQYWEDGEVPIYYEAQCQWMMHLSGATKCIVIGYIGGRYNEYEIIYNLELSMIMEQRADEFWQLVTTQTPPESCNLNDVRGMFNTHDTSIEATDTMLTAVHNLVEIKNQIFQLECKNDALELEIKLFMKDNNALKLGDKILITNKMQITNRVDTKELKKHLPDVYTKFLKQTESTRFLIRKV